MPDSGRRVYVGNLAYKTSWQDLKDHFRKIGDVVHAEIMIDHSGKGPASVQGRPLSKGCGLVEFATKELAQRAIKEMFDTDLDGRKIFVREDREGAHPNVVAREREGRAPEGGRLGDWTCPKCGDLQFARNNQCRKCSEPRPKGGASRSRSRSRRRSRSFTPSRTGRSLSASCKAARRNAKLFAGEWTCPQCGGLQFARNTACRQCSEPKPKPESEAKKAGRSRSRKGKRRRRQSKSPKKRKHAGRTPGKRSAKEGGRRRRKSPERKRRKRPAKESGKRRRGGDGGGRKKVTRKSKKKVSSSSYESSGSGSSGSDSEYTDASP